MRRIVRISVAALMAALLLASAAAQAATPAGGTLSKPNQKISWTGSFTISTLELRCDVGDQCDHFKLTLKMGEGARVRVTLPPAHPGSDLDFFIYDPRGIEIASSGNLPGEAESATFTHKARFRNKKYDIAIVPYLVAPGAAYNATAQVVKYVK